MRSRDLDNGCVRPLGHERLERRWKRLVIGADRYQHGTVFHAGGSGGVVASAAAAYGRGAAAMTAASIRVDVGGERISECVTIEGEVGAFAAVGVRERDGPIEGPTRLPSNFSRSCC